MRAPLTSPLNKAIAIAALIAFALPLMGESRRPQTSVMPLYPVIARRMRVGGIVRVNCTVDPSGKVIAAKAISGHPLLTSAAEQAVMQWRFEPGSSQSEESVEVVFNVD